MKKCARDTTKSTRQKSLDPKLAAYCAASVAFLASGQKANAGTISYSGAEDITITATSGAPTYYTLNLTGAGPLAAYTTNVEFEATTVLGSFLGLIDSAGGPQGVFDSTSNTEAALSSGTLISSASAFDGGGNAFLMGKSGKGANGDWNGVTNQYLGLTFTAGANTYYGWAELTFPDSSGTAATLEGWAYDYTPGEGILAGDTGQSGTPEPSTLPLALLALGSAGIAVLRSRK
jgi:hypothetical protein